MTVSGFKIPVVTHSVWSWLPVTMNWLHSQVSGLTDMQTCVISRDIVNQEMFPIECHAFVRGKSRRFVLRNLHRLGVRSIPGEYTSLLRNKNADILHSHFGDRGWSDIPLARKLDIPQFVSFYGLDVEYLVNRRNIWKKRYSELFREAQKVLALGPVMSSKLLALGCPEEKIKIHHLGVNVHEMGYRQRFVNIESDVLRVLVAASFREKKGIPIALEALSRIQKDIRMHITLIGDTDNSSRSNREKEKILETIRRCKLEGSVSMKGYQPYKTVIDESYKNHIFINSSVTAADGDTEGTPVVLMDMMASGIPVISTYHSDIPEIIRNGKDGWLAREGDVSDLERVIRRCVENVESWSGVARSARDRIEKNFNNIVQAKRLSEMYLDCI